MGGDKLRANRWPDEQKRRQRLYAREYARCGDDRIVTPSYAIFILFLWRYLTEIKKVVK